MKAFFIKAISFFMKEFHDVRRQPRLMLSLVGGPLLVLAAFGATFRSANPYIRTILVWPENGIPGVSQEQAMDFIGQNFTVVEVTTDKAAALAMLQAGDADVLQVIPDLASFQPGSESRPKIEVIARTIDPNAEAWIRSLAFGETNFINQKLLSQEASLAQSEGRELLPVLEQSLSEFEQLSQSLQPESLARAQELSTELRDLLAAFLAFLPPESNATASLAPELSKLHNDIVVLFDDLSELEKVLKEGEFVSQFERLNSTVEEISTLQGTIQVFVEIPPENIISPVQQTYTNLRGAPFSLVVFYAPSVLALLVQHLAITLASLGLVRERQMGAFEMFRVSPLKFAPILLGKAVAYISYVAVAGVLLTVLLGLLKVPLPSSYGAYLALLLLLATTSAGIGFLISALSRTDSQAIQLTMLVLLLSIFFTGFFLPITGFAWPAWIIALLIPMTYAIEGFQYLMLAGDPVNWFVWFGLGFITLLSYGAVLLIMRRQYRKVMD